MAVVRLCKEPGCKVRLSYYNHTNYCCLHPHVPRRLLAELSGEVVLHDDDWVRRKHWKDYPPKKIESWRPHMMGETFLRGISEDLTPEEKARYRRKGWL
jgi:hypothetical protein